MSAHRQNALDIPAHPAPIEQVTIRQPSGVLQAAALIGGAAALALVVTLPLWLQRTTAEVAPVRTPTVHVFPLEPIDGRQLAEIRAEAFRAGLDEGLRQSGCTAALSLPIAAR